MRSRVVRVRRKHARSMQLTMLLLLLSLAAYLFSWAFRLNSPVQEGAPLAPTELASAAPRETRDVRFEALSGYLVELGRYESAEAARVEAARYVLRGAAGYVYKAGEVFCVVGACYESEEEARKVAQRLGESEGLSCTVVPIAGGPAALRITASSAQIDALAGAESTVRNLVGQLGALSYALDSGTMSIDAAKEQLSLARVEAELRYQALMSAAGEDQNPIVLRMLQLTLSLSQSLQDRIVGNDATALSFSAKIKYNKIGLRMHHAELLNELGA